MFGSTLWLTLATLAGLVAGFAREWLLVAAWGAGSRSDGFLVAVFLPEALRMTLAAGLLAAAALPLYQQRDPQRQQAWLASLSPRLLAVGLGSIAGPVLRLCKAHHLLHGRPHGIGSNFAASLKLCNAGQVKPRIHVGNIGGAHNLVPLRLCRCLHGLLGLPLGFFLILPPGSGLVAGEGARRRRAVG